MSALVRTLRFPAENTVSYFQDFCSCRGIPSDIDLTIVDVWGGAMGGIWFEAPGYGAKGEYGNGQIFVPWTSLDPWFPPDYLEV